MPHTIQPITPQEALQRVIEHREIFHDEMLHIMRLIMSGEMSPVMMAAFIAGLRVKKETIGEITAAAKVMREFSTKVEVADEHLPDSAKRVEQTVEDSLIRLGVDAVHFVQIHNPPGKLYGRISTRRATMEVEHYLGAKGAMEGIARLQKAGKILHTGMSCEYAEPAQVKETIAKYRQLLRGEITGTQLWRELRLHNQIGVTRGQMAVFLVRAFGIPL